MATFQEPNQTKLAKLERQICINSTNDALLKIFNKVADLPVTFANSSRICSFVLLFGMEPTNSLLLATEMHTPMCLPGRISLLLHCKKKASVRKRKRQQNVAHGNLLRLHISRDFQHVEYILITLMH